jgi:hypothetical protein
MKLFDLWNHPVEADLTKTIINRLPKSTLQTGGAAASELLKGIYLGSNQSFNLASGGVYPAFNIPKMLVGVPILPEGNEALQSYLLDEGPIITTTMLVNGTAWRWATWDDASRRLVWQVISDGVIGPQGIEVDPASGVIVSISIDENIKYNGPKFRQKSARRQRTITKDMVTEEWTGDIKKFVQYRNPFGFMPVPFATNCWESEWRGNSVYSRIIRLIQDNHNIRRNRDEILAQFKPKMVQTTKDAGRWVKNNQRYTVQGDEEKYSPFESDFVINIEGETTAYLNIGSDATIQHTAAIADNQKEIMIASGIPEIFWGGLATGNHASTESQIATGVYYIKELQREMSKAYKQLLNQSAHILSYMQFGEAEPIDVKWGTLDMTSPEQRARIIGTYAGAIGGLLSNGSVSKEGAYFFTKLMFEDYPAEDAQQYLDGINEMLASHSSHIGESLIEAGDMGGVI